MWILSSYIMLALDSGNLRVVLLDMHKVCLKFKAFIEPFARNLPLVCQHSVRGK